MSSWLAPQLLAILVPLFAMIGWCLYRFSRRGVSAAAFRDWSIYILVGLLIVAAAVAMARTKVEPDVWMRWFTPIATAAFVFGFPVRTFRSQAYRLKFWAALSPLVLLHFVFFFSVLSPAWRGNALLVLIAGLPEMFVTYMVLIAILGRPPGPTR